MQWLRQLCLKDDGSLLIPRGETVLQSRDEVIALSSRESEAALRQMLVGS
jgi:Trk K+ transport system NAD-binding subunit